MENSLLIGDKAPTSSLDDNLENLTLEDQNEEQNIAFSSITEALASIEQISFENFIAKTKFI